MIKDSQSVNVSDANSVSVREASPEELAPLEKAGFVDFVKTTDVDEDTNLNEAISSCPPVLKKDNGLKRHIVIDTLGLVLVVLVHAANVANVTDGSEKGCDRNFFKPINCESLSGSRLSRRSLTESCSRVSTTARTRATQL